jgi:hypothetical protein
MVLIGGADRSIIFIEPKYDPLIAHGGDDVTVPPLVPLDPQSTLLPKGWRSSCVGIWIKGRPQPA